MGEDLGADGRMAVRTPMQWSQGATGGFSTAPTRRLVQRVVPGEYGPARVSVTGQLHDPDSLWTFVRKLISVYRSCPELGWGTWRVVEQDDPSVLVHLCEVEGTAVLAVHNLGSEPVSVPVTVDPRGDGLEAVDLFSAEVVTSKRSTTLLLDGYGFRWLRVRPAGDLAIP